MKAKNRAITAGELLTRLHSDPEWVARQQERERQHQEKVAPLRAAEAPLVAALQEVGVAASSVWDLVNTSNSYPEAIPVLLDHLRRPYPDRIAGGIGRALAVAEARPHWRVLLSEYESTDGTSMPWRKDGLALAVARTNDLNEVIRLLKDASHGHSRLLLLLALRRSRDPTAVATVQELSSDPFFAKEIGAWQRKRR